MTREDEGFEALKKELAAEIAAINASNPSREDLVRELAVNRVLLRYEKETTEYRKKAISMFNELVQAAKNGAALLEEARKQNAELNSLLPKVFEAGKKSFAKAGASAANAENRAMKQDVFAWLDKNPPKKLDAAADAIHGLKLVPVTWRVIRKWVGEWKKLRSTGTA